jgi:chromosome segregation ATPase
VSALGREATRLQGQGAEKDARIAALEGEARAAAAELGRRDGSVAALSQQLAGARQEAGLLQEKLCARERSLEAAMSQLAETNAALSASGSRLEALGEEHAAAAAKLKTLSASSGAEAELRRQAAALAEEGREKDRRLQAYDQEGQALARKQGDMEKLVRRSKTELREREAEVAKLKDGREQLVKTIEEMQEIIRLRDSDSTTTSKSISAMQAVSQASMDRLAKLEAELSGKAEEILNQKRALDSAWGEIAELKRSSAEVRAERDDVKKHTGQRDGRLAELEAAGRALEQREAVLRATNAQLQDSLQRQMRDSAGREDRLREETSDARKRWQDAISSRESLAAEVGQSTGPLLRQIAGLQESIKHKSEAWQGVESALLERALRAESLAESSSYKMKTVEEKYMSASKSNDELSFRLRDKESQLADLEMSSERSARQEREFAERAGDLESRLHAESTLRLNAQSAMRELESRMKGEAREGAERLEAASKQSQLKLAALAAEIEYLKEQLDAYKPQGQGQGGGGDSGGQGAAGSAAAASKLQGNSSDSLHAQGQSALSSSSSNGSSSNYSNRNNSANNSYLSSKYSYTHSHVAFPGSEFSYVLYISYILYILYI